MMNNNQNSGALSWDSTISQESSFIVLPEGEYNFVVEKMERGQFQPSPNSKIRETSPQAELTLKVFSPEHGEANVLENLILHTATEWKISEFFISIGQKRKGEPFVPNWAQVPGSRGRAKIEVNKYTNKNGEQRENNRITQFLEPAANNQAVPSANQSYSQPQPQSQQYQSQQPPAEQNNQPQNNPGFQF